MMEWPGITAFAEAASIPYGIFGLILTYILRDVDRWPKRLCVVIMSSSIIVAIANLVEGALMNYFHAPIPVCHLVMLINIPLFPVPTLLMTAYFLYSCGEDYRRSALMYSQCILVAFLIIIEYAAHAAGKISITPGYEVHSEGWSIICLYLPVAITAVLLIGLFKRWKRPTVIQWIIFLLCFITPSYIQGILMEFLLMVGLVRRYQEQQEESARQNAHIAVLQMRPHFIHNTLMSIYYLCAQDPEKAQAVIKDFSRYLQANFTAIAKDDTIPFSEELEHTRAYLAVEQARFEGQLFVDFDTPDTFFRIPPLTLQPIVENAVKHGLDPDMGPLYVSVTTEDTDTGIRIIVEDTGPGYAPSNEDPQFAISSIRKRLEAMCGGALQIEAREAGGTRVTMFIPKR